MRYGKIITETSYFDNKQSDKKIWHRESVEIVDRAHLLNEVLECFDLVLENHNEQVDLTLKRNKQGKLSLVKLIRVK